MPFTFVIGGRGTGKTYGALKYAIENKLNIALIRRTQTQIDMLQKPDLNPFNALSYDMGIKVAVEKESKQHSSLSIEGETFGFMAALSTFANLRGFSDGGKTTLLIYDEFIPELHERKIPNEDSAFLNMYETINRNRELQGKAPLQCLLLSNSNFLASPILLTLNIADTVAQMRDRGKTEYLNPQRGIAIFNLWDSPISLQKSNTALYRATRGTDFGRMALDNAFTNDDMSDIAQIPLKECKLIMQVGNVYIYSYPRGWYVSTHAAGVPRKVYKFSQQGIAEFRAENSGAYRRIIEHKIKFENFYCKNIFLSIYG